MHGQGLARFILGILGNIIQGSLFLSPSPVFWRIYKKKSTESFHPYPYLAAAISCCFGIFYGLPMVRPNSILVTSINSAGLAIELAYLTIFFIYTTKKYRVIVISHLLIEAALVAVVVVVTLLCFHDHASRSMLVGITCIVAGIIMYASPLSIIRKVVKTQSTEFMPFWLCAAGFANGLVWFIFANLKPFDPYIATGTGSGCVLGFIQLCVYAFYTLKGKRNGREESDDVVKPTEVKSATNVPPA